MGVDPIFLSRQFRIKYPDYWDKTSKRLGYTLSRSGY
ncbi:hypothetical protein ACEQPO_26810 [Bacillus sp. SL00103]